MNKIFKKVVVCSALTFMLTGCGSETQTCDFSTFKEAYQKTNNEPYSFKEATIKGTYSTLENKNWETISLKLVINDMDDLSTVKDEEYLFAYGFAVLYASSIWFATDSKIVSDDIQGEFTIGGELSAKYSDFFYKYNDHGDPTYLKLTSSHEKAEYFITYKY